MTVGERLFKYIQCDRCERPQNWEIWRWSFVSVHEFELKFTLDFAIKSKMLEVWKKVEIEVDARSLSRDISPNTIYG